MNTGGAWMLPSLHTESFYVVVTWPNLSGSVRLRCSFCNPPTCSVWRNQPPCGLMHKTEDTSPGCVDSFLSLVVCLSLNYHLSVTKAINCSRPADGEAPWLPTTQKSPRQPLSQSCEPSFERRIGAAVILAVLWELFVTSNQTGVLHVLKLCSERSSVSCSACMFLSVRSCWSYLCLTSS